MHVIWVHKRVQNTGCYSITLVSRWCSWVQNVRNVIFVVKLSLCNGATNNFLIVSMEILCKNL